MSSSTFYWQASLVCAGLALCLLVAQQLVSRAMAHQAEHKPSAFLSNVAQRIRSWWSILIAIGLCVPTGRWGVLVLFFLVSLQCLKEFMSVLPTRTADHRALVWCFYVALPVHYLGMLLGLGALWQGLATSIAAGLGLLPASKSPYTAWRYLGVLVCVVALGFLPLLVWTPLALAHEEKMMLVGFLLLVVQCSDIAQFLCGKAWGRHALALQVSPGKTWEGVVAGLVVATALGAVMHWMTPFTSLQAATLAFALATLGVLSGLCLSAVKRRFGVKDWGGVLPGHGGLLDRVDSLIFPAPALYAYCQWVTIIRA